MWWINPDGFNEPLWDNNEVQKKMPTENHLPAFNMSQLRYRGHPRNTITDAQHFIDKQIWVCVQNDEIIVSIESIKLPPEMPVTEIEHVAIIPRFFILENDLPLYDGDTVKLLDTVSKVCWELKVAYNDTMIQIQKRRTLTDGKFDIWKKEMLDLGVAWMGFQVIEAKSTLWNTNPDRNYLRLVWETEGVSHPNWYMSDISEPLFPVFLDDGSLFIHGQILNWSRRDSETLLMGGLL